MTYEEALAKVRVHSDEYDSLREAADVLERERRRWEELRGALGVMKQFAVQLEKRGHHQRAPDVIQSVISGMDKMLKEQEETNEKKEES